jgi:hypothetical protein
LSINNLTVFILQKDIIVGVEEKNNFHTEKTIKLFPDSS